MGILIDGVWHDQPPNPNGEDGRFVRTESAFRSWVTADGSAGPTGESGFPAEPDRYRLYVSLACPWAHRTLIFRRLKGLDNMIPVAVTHWRMLENGWTFDAGPGVVADDDTGIRAMHELYTRADAHYNGRATVPVLWDCKRETIVSNESADIIRMFNHAFDALGAHEGNYYPAHLQSAIDAVNERVYHNVNNGVYKAGFATTQSAYEEAVEPVFATLDWLEAELEGQPWLCGDTLTEADWRLFTTLIRYDAVYYGHFKCNRRRIVDYPNLWGLVQRLYNVPGVAQTVDFHHIKSHYYESHRNINPTGIVPVGPDLAFGQPPPGP